MQNKRYSLPKCLRLLKPAEFQPVFSRQQKIYYQGLVVYHCENMLPHPRLGIAVAKRHIKRAVDRNRIKRQVRESFRLHQDRLGNQDIIIVATSKLIGDNPCSIPTALNEIWRKLAVPHLCSP